MKTYYVIVKSAVTCVQFNPVDDSYFISGSIDGKVRIWSIDSSQVVDWTDIREIITAVTYNPDGKVWLFSYRLVQYLDNDISNIMVIEIVFFLSYF